MLLLFRYFIPSSISSHFIPSSISSHFIHFIQFITFHHFILFSISSHFITFHPVNFAPLHFITFFISSHFITFHHFISHHFTSSHFEISSHFIRTKSQTSHSACNTRAWGPVTRVFFFMRMQNAFKTFCFDRNPPPSSFGSVWFVLAPFGLKNVEILKKVLWFSNHRTRKTIFW